MATARPRHSRQTVTDTRRTPRFTFAWRKVARTCALVAAVSGNAGLVAAQDATPSHAIAMHGSPAYGADFSRFDYVNPEAPHGGTLRLAALGTFDSLNPYIVRGKAAVGLHHGYTTYFETLARRSRDEPFTLYGLLAETIAMPEDRAWVEFTLRPEARFSDGTPVTVDDVVFSWETLKAHGYPNARATWSRVARVEPTGERRVRFTFADTSDREMPMLVAGFMPILSKGWWAGRDFTQTTFDAPVASGPYVVDSVDPGRSITFRRDPDYWGDGLAVTAGQFNIAEIRYDYYRDEQIAFEAFKAHGTDYREEGDAARWATRYDFPAARDGSVIAEVLEDGTPSGLSALVMNLRQPRFADRRVRRALTLAFDFDWINQTLLHGGYERTSGMFTGSDLAPNGPPSPGEVSLLTPWKAQIPEQVFGPAYDPPSGDGSGRNRANLREAAGLLEEAGWRVVEGVRRNADGRPFTFEITLRQPSNQKIALAYARSLERLGIEARVRLVESAQFQALMDDYGFDMVFGFWGVTLSPGNEQQNYWSSLTANQPGGRNWAGVADPAIDAMIDALGAARTREQLVDAARALDRVLMWNNYVIPLYHDPGQRIARWQEVRRPATVPLYGQSVETLWIEP